MKDIKTLMIGFLLATCMFLMMGLSIDYDPVDIPFGHKVYAEDVVIMNCNKEKYNDCAQSLLDNYLEYRFDILFENWERYEAAKSRNDWWEKDVQMRLELLELNAGLRDVDDWPGKKYGSVKPDYWPTK